jgi:excisionase family DNA binding protein
MEKLLTIRELAERLNIAEGTAYHWLSAGRLKCIRFSKRCIRFRETDVQELLDKLTDTPRMQNRSTNKALGNAKIADPKT